MSVYGLPGVITGAGEAGGSTLAALTLAASTFTEGDAPGTVIGAINSKTANSRLSVFAPSDKFYINASNQLCVGLVPTVGVATINVDIDEALGAANNSPRRTRLALTVTAAGALGPVAMSYNTGSAAGSTIAAFTGLLTGEKVVSVNSDTGRFYLSPTELSLLKGTTPSSAGVRVHKFTTNFGRQFSSVVTTVLASGSAVLPSLYLGPVATRTYFNDGFAAATNTHYNCISAHYARDDITSLKLLYSTIYVNIGGGYAESNNNGNTTRTASIEYPDGVFTQVMWSASATVVQAGGTVLASDFVNVSIPKGAKFKVRQHIIAATRIQYTNKAIGHRMDLTLGDAVEANATDKTMGGTITDNAGGGGMCPQAILGMTRLPSIGAIGSSRMAGQKDTTGDGFGNTGYSRLYGQDFAYMDYSLGGDSNANVSTAKGATRRSLINTYCSHLWMDPGLNDLNTGGLTAAQDMTAIRLVTDAFPGGLSNVIINDEGPWNVAGPAVQTWEAERVNLNNAIGALTGFNQIVRINVIEDNGAGLWNPGYVDADLVHETAAGLALIKTAAPFNKALVVRT